MMTVQHFFSIPGSFLKNILLEKEYLFATDEDYKTAEAYIAYLEQGKKKKLDTNLRIPYTGIHKIILFPEDNGLQLYYETSKTFLQLATEEEYRTILHFILSRKKLSARQQKIKGSISAWIRPALYTVAALAFSVALTGMAHSIDSGGKQTAVSGSKKGIKRALVSLAEVLGTWGALALGLLVTGGLAFYTWKQYRKSGVIREIYT